MKKRKIVQIGILVKDLQKSMERYWETLNIGPWDVHTFSSDTVKEFILCGQQVKSPFKFMVALAKFGDIQFELLQPVEGPTIYENFLKEKGEGFHHIKEKVADNEIEETLKKFKQKGLEVIQSGKCGTDVFYYLNTEPTLSILYEIGNDGEVGPPERRYPPNKPN